MGGVHPINHVGPKKLSRANADSAFTLADPITRSQYLWADMHPL